MRMAEIHRFSSRRQRLDHTFLANRLKGATSYKRIAGYFRSSIFELVGEEIADIPHVQMVCNSELDAADVVVYVHVELRSSVGPSGRLQFMSAGGGRRYLRVSVEPGGQSWGDVLSRRHELTAVLAHELQHATEVAAATAVVDMAGFRELYRSIGIRLDAGVFDTVAARLVGERVLSELRTRERGVCLEEL
jgi:hypothetical protein